MNTKRIKEIQQETAYPESVSVQQALLKVWNECEQDWVALAEKLPTVEEHGEKVLLYRVVNEGQMRMAISIHDTKMVKYCNVNETWWRVVPEPPCR